MRFYCPEPNPPGKPKACVECETRIDGDDTEGYWLERENWQDPNTYYLFCLDCCAEKMTEWPNHLDVDGADAAKEILYE